MSIEYLSYIDPTWFTHMYTFHLNSTLMIWILLLVHLGLSILLQMMLVFHYIL